MKPGTGTLIAGAALFSVGAFVVPVVTVLTLIGGIPQMQQSVAPGTAEHNDPHHRLRKFTSRHAGPWLLMHQEVYTSRAEGMRREKWLKSEAGRAWLDNVIRASPPEAD